MAATTLDAVKCSPEWMLWRKTLSGDEPGTLKGAISTGDLRGQRQEQFIQVPLCKEVTHELRSTLDQNHVTPAYTAHGLQDRLGAEWTGALNCQNLDRRREMLFADVLQAMCRCDNQHGNLTGLKNWQVEVDITVCSDNDVQWRFWFPEIGPKLPVYCGERWINVFRSPAVMRYRPECASTNDHGVGNCSQQSHDHPIVLIGPTNLSAARVTRFPQ